MALKKEKRSRGKQKKKDQKLYWHHCKTKAALCCDVRMGQRGPGWESCGAAVPLTPVS